jgi:hypothetical protein
VLSSLPSGTVEDTVIRRKDIQVNTLILTTVLLIAAIAITIMVSAYSFRQLGRRQQEEREAQLRYLITSIARATDDKSALR